LVRQMVYHVWDVVSARSQDRASSLVHTQKGKRWLDGSKKGERVTVGGRGEGSIVLTHNVLKQTTVTMRWVNVAQRSWKCHLTV
jgi:hypothetical protein